MTDTCTVGVTGVAGYIDTVETLLEDPDVDATTFLHTSVEEMSGLDSANLVQQVCEGERGYAPEVELVENLRGDETTGSDFSVETSHAGDVIGFEAGHSIETMVREMLSEGE